MLVPSASIYYLYFAIKEKTRSTILPHALSFAICNLFLFLPLFFSCFLIFPFLLSSFIVLALPLVQLALSVATCNLFLCSPLFLCCFLFFPFFGSCIVLALPLVQLVVSVATCNLFLCSPLFLCCVLFFPFLLCSFIVIAFALLQLVCCWPLWARLLVSSTRCSAWPSLLMYCICDAPGIPLFCSLWPHYLYQYQGFLLNREPGRTLGTGFAEHRSEKYPFNV